MKQFGWHRLRDNDIIGATFNELLLLFVFAFLILIVSVYQDLKRERVDRQEMEDVVAIIGSVAQIIKDRVLVPETPLDPPPKAADEVDSEELARQIEDRLAEIENILAAAQEEKWSLPDILETIKKLGGPEDAKKMAAALIEKGKTVPDAIKMLQGVGKPPCWYSGEKPAYNDAVPMFDVYLYDEYSNVKKGWPDDWNEKAEDWSAPRILEALQGDIQIETFFNLTSPIFEQSTTETPECRHFVRLFDRTQSKDAYKDGLRYVEGHFFKKLMD